MRKIRCIWKEKKKKFNKKKSQSRRSNKTIQKTRGKAKEKLLAIKTRREYRRFFRNKILSRIAKFYSFNIGGKKKESSVFIFTFSQMESLLFKQRKIHRLICYHDFSVLINLLKWERGFILNSFNIFIF